MIKKHIPLIYVYINLKKSYFAKCPSTKQVYNWINEGKIFLAPDKLCYKKRNGKKTGMMAHFQWNLDHI